jgi:hypothetical protein
MEIFIDNSLMVTFMELIVLSSARQTPHIIFSIKAECRPFERMTDSPHNFFHKIGILSKCRGRRIVLIRRDAICVSISYNDAIMYLIYSY